MSVKLKTWISAARLRTLPLSISGILVGTALAIEKNNFDWVIFLLALGTTLGLQILSNFANDYGDGVKGTDNENRVGPMRALQSGIISDKEMKKAMIITSAISFLLALLLIYRAFGSDNFLYSIFFLIAGIASIAAAIKYTVGKSAYGYRGLGDIFVFVFFGLLSVCGTYFLYTQKLNFLIFFPAISIGLLSTAVLNLNNMRDRISDKQAGKITLVVNLGEKNAKLYHASLIIIAFLSVSSYIILNEKLILFFTLLAFVPLLLHLTTVFKTKIPDHLDPELKKVALSTFLFSVLFLGLVLV
ncbi:1,4-dihydroxy-2-naphthoate octaprenyltransferase [Mesonia maritima]|uniref:1,4-dihydroxy-2-naphthoate octaprenyltransferase n=1 Tax=Mesonia maritima TaxID=1793873 RepID=A0ABU1K5M7_9FLAO|nr:1,4-dihydroxy-2-naphthoate octaprenyltransferase [Mesonia maritima]MDR6300919.1 1,4-dihydroxy-2-naphthoate octaprenyltransferase [Mesonia maritima]